MRYYVLPLEGLSDDLSAALTRGLGLSPRDVEACARHCERYGVDDVDAFVEELGEAQAALATAKVLGAPIRVDWCGRLCYDLALAPDVVTDEETEEPWKDDAWLAAFVGEKRTA